MKKYKRIALEVQAEQYFPYKKIAVEGFSNVIEEMLNDKTMEKTSVVKRAEIVRGDIKLNVLPGDWVVIMPDGAVSLRKCAEFSADFVDASFDEPHKQNKEPSPVG